MLLWVWVGMASTRSGLVDNDVEKLIWTQQVRKSLVSGLVGLTIAGPHGPKKLMIFYSVIGQRECI